MSADVSTLVTDNMLCGRYVISHVEEGTLSVPLAVVIRGGLTGRAAGTFKLVSWGAMRAGYIHVQVRESLASCTKQPSTGRWWPQRF